MPTAGGIADWTPSAALNGYQMPDAAGAIVGTSYPYYAVSLDLTTWEIGEGDWDGTKLARTIVHFNSLGTGTAPGQSGDGTKINFSAVPMVAVVALQELLLQVIGGQTITGGFAITPFNIGTVTTGAVIPNPLVGNYQYLTNNGAFTLAAPAVDCAIDILITNGSTAGVITFSGFTVNAVTGEPLTTTNGSKFIISLRRINGVSTYLIKALQ